VGVNVVARAEEDVTGAREDAVNPVNRSAIESILNTLARFFCLYIFDASVLVE
jgi:hypothetical protein